MKDFLHSRINLNLFKFNVRNKKGLLFFYTLLLSLTFPVFIIVAALSGNGSNISNNEVLTSLILLTLMLILILVLTPFLFFNFLNTKKSVDVFHSLAIKKNDLYLTYLSLILFFVFVPLTISYWGGYFLAYNLTEVSFEMFHLYHYGRLLMVSIAVIAPSIFVIMNTGTLADSLIYTGILMIAPFVAFASFQAFAQVFIIGFGVSSGYSLTYLSPLVGLFTIVDSFKMPVDGHLVASYWLLLGIITNLFSLKLYKNWKSEMSEVPFSNKTFFPFVTSLFIGIVFVLLLALNINPNPKWAFLSIENLIIPIIVTYAMFLILFFLKDRSIDSIKKASKNYLILFVVIMVITTSLYFTQGFGYTYRLPKDDEIVSVEVSSQRSNLPFVAGNKVTIINPDEVKNIYNLHHQLIDQIKKDKDLFRDISSSDYVEPMFTPYQLFGDYSDVTIKYKLENNGKLNRTFKIPNEYHHLLLPLAQLESFKVTNNPIIDPSARLDSNRFTLYDSLFQKEYSFVESDDASIRKALYEDMIEMKHEEFYQANSKINFVLIYSFDGLPMQINIDARFKNTLKLLTPETLILNEDYDASNLNYAIVPSTVNPDNLLKHGISRNINQNFSMDITSPISEGITLHDALKYQDQLYDKQYDGKETFDVLLISIDYGQIAFPIVTK
ncbi:hypothetical protein ERUR111494_07460 [Erysipelothrix urinaevulpis]|uniref:hypothetical protein n=1 Tax=Erysipelothrix urinaevulpis TaxID=2683717 RepID=UPI00135B8B76|nr:hypothetical protein [Erysipelothrix urinaevulpis]